MLPRHATTHPVKLLIRHPIPDDFAQNPIYRPHQADHATVTAGRTHLEKRRPLRKAQKRLHIIDKRLLLHQTTRKPRRHPIVKHSHEHLQRIQFPRPRPPKQKSHRYLALRRSVVILNHHARHKKTDRPRIQRRFANLLRHPAAIPAYWHRRKTAKRPFQRPQHIPRRTKRPRQHHHHVRRHIVRPKKRLHIPSRNAVKLIRIPSYRMPRLAIKFPHEQIVHADQPIPIVIRQNLLPDYLALRRYPRKPRRHHHLAEKTQHSVQRLRRQRHVKTRHLPRRERIKIRTKTLKRFAQTTKTRIPLRPAKHQMLKHVRRPGHPLILTPGPHIHHHTHTVHRVIPAQNHAQSVPKRPPLQRHRFHPVLPKLDPIALRD